MLKTKSVLRPKTQKRLLPALPTFNSRACSLDRLADFELQHGHHVRAEQLARRAAEIREGAR